MYLSKDPTFRFWLTVYSFPATIPLLASLAFSVLVKPSLTDALGVQGTIIATKVNIACMLLFLVLIILANAAAYWHQVRKVTAISQSPIPVPGSN